MLILLLAWYSVAIVTVTRVLTGELGLPLGEALLLYGVQVGQVIVFVFQGLLLQAECGEAPGCIPACKHSIRSLCNTAHTLISFSIVA